MADLFEIQALFTGTSHQVSFGSYDGTYIWFVTRKSTSDEVRLWRFRVSDKALVKPDGTVGDATDAFVALEVWSAYHCVVSDGTYVTVNEHNAASSIEIFSAADMSRLGAIAIGNTSATEMGFAYNGYHYHPGWNSTNGRACIWEINPATGAFTRVYTSADPATSTGVYLIRQGNFAYLTDTSNNGFGVEKIDMTTWTRVWLSVSPGVPRISVGSYDATREELWFCANDAEVVRIRDSDGAYLDRSGNATTYASAKIVAADGGINVGIGVLADGDVVYTGGGATEQFMVRRSTSIVTSWATNYAAPVLSKTAAYLFNVTPLFKIDNTVYCMTSCRASLTWGSVGVAWFDVNDAAAVPNLTAVTPGTGPRISLTFDNPVTATAPTIGGASSGLGVTGVTEISATQIDLACAIRPDAPVGEADTTTLTPPVGEADNLGPPVPVGVGATVL